jgi:hypothetical protein
LSFLSSTVRIEIKWNILIMSYVAVAPTYEMAPTMPHVYKAARERIAGLKKNMGLRVAAWQALNAYEEPEWAPNEYYESHLQLTSQKRCFCTGLSGGVYNVPIIVPILPTRLTPRNTPKEWFIR